MTEHVSNLIRKSTLAARDLRVCLRQGETRYRFGESNGNFAQLSELSARELFPQKLKCYTLLATVCLSILLSAPTNLVAQLAPFDRDSIKIADSVRLRSGTRIRGEIIKQGKNEAGRAYTIIKTESQSTLKLDNRFVDSTHIVNDDDKIYNNKITIMDDTPEHHWSAVEWCGKQSSGKIRYKDQIDFHLNRIMLLDPNDTRVRHRLGYDYLQEQDRWVPKKLYWTSLGYRSNGGRAWVPTLQDDAIQHANNRNSNLGEKKSRFSAWKSNVRLGKSSKTQLANELFSFVDASAVPMVFEAAKKEKSSAVRGLYVEAFGKIASSGAAQALVFFSVEDEFNRDRALDLLLQDHYNPSFVAGHLARYFDPNKHSNTTLQRAAFNRRRDQRRPFDPSLGWCSFYQACRRPGGRPRPVDDQLQRRRAIARVFDWRIKQTQNDRCPKRAGSGSTWQNQW